MCAVLYPRVLHAERGTGLRADGKCCATMASAWASSATTGRTGRVGGMSLQRDLDHAAVTVAALALTARLPDIGQARLLPAAEAAIAAARPFLDGTEHARIADSGRSRRGGERSGGHAGLSRRCRLNSRPDTSGTGPV
jgi:hypothetical protein